MSVCMYACTQACVQDVYACVYVVCMHLWHKWKYIQYSTIGSSCESCRKRSAHSYWHIWSKYVKIMTTIPKVLLINTKYSKKHDLLLQHGSCMESYHIVPTKSIQILRLVHFQPPSLPCCLPVLLALQLFASPHKQALGERLLLRGFFQKPQLTTSDSKEMTHFFKHLDAGPNIAHKGSTTNIYCSWKGSAYKELESSHCRCVVALPVNFFFTLHWPCKE